MEYLCFHEIGVVPFKEVLDWLNIPFTETQQNELRGQGFIVNISKNLYTNPTGKDKGGIINFVATNKNIDLRSAAKLIKDQFLLPGKPVKELKLKIPELRLYYHPFLYENGIPENVAEACNVGYCKDKSIMAGKICFKVGEHYAGYDPKTDKWLFPKNFKRNTLWNIEKCDGDVIFVTRNPFKALKMITKGYNHSASFLGAEMTQEQKELVNKYAFVFVG